VRGISHPFAGMLRDILPASGVDAAGYRKIIDLLAGPEANAPQVVKALNAAELAEAEEIERVGRNRPWMARLIRERKMRIYAR
jgi:hypothetical protein